MNLPVHLQNRQRRDLATIAVGGINSGSPAHISIAGNRFTLVDDAGNQKPIQTLFLDVCVIDANASVSKIYFDPRTPFEPGGDNSNPPMCWSDNGIGASAQASSPQNTSCQLCPHNAWGSATSRATGKATKACNDVKKVAVLVPGIDMVFLLRIPPASLKNWGKYCNTLAGHGVDLPDAITRLEFESQGILKFDPKGYVDEATASATDKAIAAKATDVLVGRNDRPWSGQGDAAKIAYAEKQAPVQISQQPMAPPPQPFLAVQQGNATGQQWGDKVTVQEFGTPPQPFGETHDPFIAPQPGVATFGQHTSAPARPAATTSVTDPFGQVGTSSPPDATPFGAAAQPTPARRTRGPKPNKAKAPEPVPTGDDGIPPFLRRDAVPPVTTPTNPTQFGMQQNPAAPDAGVQAALDAAFRLPT